LHKEDPNLKGSSKALEDFIRKYCHGVSTGTGGRNSRTHVDIWNDICEKFPSLREDQPTAHDRPLKPTKIEAKTKTIPETKPIFTLSRKQKAVVQEWDSSKLDQADLFKYSNHLYRASPPNWVEGNEMQCRDPAARTALSNYIAKGYESMYISVSLEDWNCFTMACFIRRNEISA
jgi:hypothetical protein